MTRIVAVTVGAIESRLFVEGGGKGKRRIPDGRRRTREDDERRGRCRRLPEKRSKCRATTRRRPSLGRFLPLVLGKLRVRTGTRVAYKLKELKLTYIVLGDVSIHEPVAPYQRTNMTAGPTTGRAEELLVGLKTVPITLIFSNLALGQKQVPSEPDRITTHFQRDQQKPLRGRCLGPQPARQADTY